jgi:hypothetical protein
LYLESEISGIRVVFYWGNIIEKMFGRAAMVDGSATLRRV